MPALTHSPADVLRFLIIQLGLGTLPTDSLDWPAFCGMEPGSPDKTITTYDTAGVKNGRSMVNGESIVHPGVQVRVRGTDDSRTAYQKSAAIQAALDEQVRNTEISIDGSHYVVNAVSRPASILSLGNEAPTSKRKVFTANYTVTLRQLA